MIFGLTKRETATQQSEQTLELLWVTAESFGTVQVFGNEERQAPSRYRVTIKFATIAGTVLEAKSEFNMPIRDALIMAIERAQLIKGQFR